MSKLNPKKTLALFFSLLALGGIMETIDVYYDPRYSQGAMFTAPLTVTVAFIALAAFFWRAGTSKRP